MRRNNIREKLARGKAAIGCCININSPHLVELAGAIGFEWVFIDCEHGSMSETDVEHMVRAAEAFEMTPVVRVPSNSASEILRFLDLGAMGIVVPHVDTEADARKAAAAAKYPPLGQRGSNYGTGRNNNYGIGTEDVRDYYEESNRETILFALIESREGVENISDIVATPGVDGTWLGPADLALSMGMPEKRVIDEALDRVVETTIEAGKLSAATHMAPDDAERFAHFHRMGTRALAVQLLSILKLGAGRWIQDAREVVA